MLSITAAYGGSASTFVDNTFTYQGKLVRGEFAVNDSVILEFTLWNAAAGGELVGGPYTADDVQVTDGLFAVELNFGSQAFDGESRWLEIKVTGSADSVATTLSPRQPLTATPYAQTAIDALNAWGTGGNSNTDPDVDFLGTTDNTPFAMKVNDVQVLQLNHVPPGSGLAYGNNIIGGYWLNSLESGVSGVTVFGGVNFDSEDWPNTVLCTGGTVSGGGSNQAGIVGGSSFSDGFAVVSGGSFNTASGASSCITGGFRNDATARGATVTGGQMNEASGEYAAVTGGDHNVASGINSFVAGGTYNEANGRNSFAAGRMAKANHNGAFVWADSEFTEFASTNDDQFLIRAFRGVGINKNNPATALDVNGTVTATAFVGDGTALTVTGDDLGDHAATQMLDMASFDISNAGTVTAEAFVGDGSALTNLTVNETQWSDGAEGDLYYLDGDIGLGTDSPTGEVHVYRSDEDVQLTVERGSETGSFATLFGADEFGGIGYDAAGGFRIGPVDATTDLPLDTSGIVFDSVGNISIPGDITGRVDMAGNLNVGGNLDVEGNIEIDGLTVDGGTFYVNELSHRVGIGVEFPLDKFDIRGSTRFAQDIFGNNLRLVNEDGAFRFLNSGLPIWLGPSGNALAISTNGRVGIGGGLATLPDAKLHVYGNNTLPMRVQRDSSDGTLIDFKNQSLEIAGSISVSGSTISYNSFTGSHLAWSDDQPQRGQLVVMTGDNRGEALIEEPIYGVEVSRKANDSRCLGAYLAPFADESKEHDEPKLQIMSVGNGHMWVVDSGRNIEPGDYLISSDVAGHAMLDDPERFGVGYVIARAAAPVDWSEVEESIDGRKHVAMSVTFENFVRGSAAVAQMQQQLTSQQVRLDRLEVAIASLISQATTQE